LPATRPPVLLLQPLIDRGRAHHVLDTLHALLAYLDKSSARSVDVVRQRQCGRQREYGRLMMITLLPDGSSNIVTLRYAPKP
jgi:hypothetical protein